MAVLVGVAGVGLLTSLLIHRLPIANPTRRVPWNPAGEAIHDLRVLWSNRPLLLAALGSALFWGLAGLFQVNVDKYATEGLGLTPTGVAILLAVLACGVAAGNIAAGWISGSRIELGLVPFAAGGIIFAAILLAVLPIGVVPAGGVALGSSAYLMSAACLFLLGIGAGMYDVPLQSFSAVPESGRFARNDYGSEQPADVQRDASGIGDFRRFGQFSEWPHDFSGQRHRPCAGRGGYDDDHSARNDAFPDLVPFAASVPSEDRGLENVPAHGGALLTPNHISWADGLLVGLTSPRHPHFLVYAQYFEYPPDQLVRAAGRRDSGVAGQEVVGGAGVADGARDIASGRYRRHLPRGGG